MTSKLADEISYKLETRLYTEETPSAACAAIDSALDEVRTVLESFRVRVTGCWCYSTEFHTDRCKAAQELFEKLRKE